MYIMGEEYAMTESKWALVFLMIFLVMIFRFEYKVILLSQLLITRNNYNMQLDTTLTDVLDTVNLYEEDASFFFCEPEDVVKELETQLVFDFGAWNGKQDGEQGEHILFLILYEPDGFYYLEPGMDLISEKIFFGNEEDGKKIEEIESFMEAKLSESFLMRQKPGRMQFSFPGFGDSVRARTIKGTGILMLYEAEVFYFEGKNYERFILSGATVEQGLGW